MPIELTVDVRAGLAVRTVGAKRRKAVRNVPSCERVLRARMVGKKRKWKKMPLHISPISDCAAAAGAAAGAARGSSESARAVRVRALKRDARGKRGRGAPCETISGKRGRAHPK